MLTEFFTNDVIVTNFPFLLQGIKTTLVLALWSILFSLLLGTVLGILRYFNIPIISFISSLFIEFTRAIPLILYIIFIHYTFSNALYNPDSFIKYLGINSLEMHTAFISLILFTSAYIAEIVRSGMGSIDRQQIWDAKSLGLSTFQTLIYIVLPVVFIRSMPALIAQFASLIKDTSLVSVIGLVELTRCSEILSQISNKDLEVMTFVAFIYFIICYTLSFIANKISNKYSFITKTA